jgi:hypothetical protein
MGTLGAILLCLGVFIAVDSLGWLLVVNRMTKTEQAIVTVLQYVVAQHGDPLPPHVAALIPVARRGTHER